MTIKDTITLCRALGINCKWSTFYHEFTLWPKGTDEDRTSYFTDDRYDAVDTALYMAAEVRKTKALARKYF